MTLNEMRQLLESRNIQLTKSLGQNFLHDGNQLRRIVASAGLIPTDRVLEIGPGLGPLTESLVTQSASVLAIEKDERLVQVLRERFPSFRGQIEINAASLESTAEPVTENRSIGSFEEGGLLHADALRWLQATRRDWTGWKLVANLPYSVASPILVELAMALVPPDRMVATLQAEVVRRIAAAPDTDDYGILTLLLGLQFEVKRVVWHSTRLFLSSTRSGLRLCDIDSPARTLIGACGIRKLCSTGQTRFFTKTQNDAQTA